MAFKLSDFTSQVRDVVRNYQFEMEIIFPQIVGGANTDLVNILTESATIPSKNYTEVDASFAGQPIKFAGNIAYPSWSCQFRVDDNYEVYKKFRAWSELVVGTETNIAAFPRQYKTTVNLYQLDGAGNRIIAYNLVGTWCSQIGEETLDYAQRTISTVQVTFEFDYFLQKTL